MVRGKLIFVTPSARMRSVFRNRLVSASCWEYVVWFADNRITDKQNWDTVFLLPVPVMFCSFVFAKH